ncbi:transposase [Streptomyces avermitilis]|uniref:transposase n=1 Tax=Streptomyces avermitilis TaxID=33903 RepID=UPI0033AD7553
MSDLLRKNCWTISEWAGETASHGMQRLLCRASWNADAVREYVVEHLHDKPTVLVVDETGDVKKSTYTVGAQRQYTGTADRIENSQVAFISSMRGCAGTRRWTGVVRPPSWTCDPDLCRAAGLGDDTCLRPAPRAKPCFDRSLAAVSLLGTATRA